jgi:hypothetical protein
MNEMLTTLEPLYKRFREVLRQLDEDESDGSPLKSKDEVERVPHP